MPPGERMGVAPLASSVDVGWSDGNPRPLEEQTKAFLSGKKQPPGAAPVGPQGQWAPRPRSKNAPRPAALVSYGEGVGEVRRNNMDAVDLEGPTMEELILQNAESMKQFEYLEKSLVTFQNAASLQAADLRQPVVRERHVMADLAPLDDEDQQDAKVRTQKKGGVAAKSQSTRQGAPPVFPDVLVGRSDAMIALSNIYAEGDTPYADKHLQPLDPIIVEGEGYLYGIRSIQIVALKETVRGNDFVNVYSGTNHSVGITAAGQCYTWGANTMYQLGYPGAEQGILGIDMDPRVVNALHGEVVVAAACGKLHTVVLTEEGNVWSWGAYGHGQLGLGDVSKKLHPFGWVEPTRIKSLDKTVRSVACGQFHTVMIDGMGDLWSCGTKDHGAHGQDSLWDVSGPTIIGKVHGKDFRQVACGALHTIALTASGQLYAWGLNEDGQLGLGDSNDRLQPELLAAVTGRNIRAIACGNSHSMFLSDRDVFTFGCGNAGALGHGNSKAQFEPKRVVKLTEECRLRDVSAGPQYSVALSDLGQLFFWGNMRSTAGRGANKTVYNMPRRFKGLEAIFAVACGEHEVSALVRIPVAPPLEHKFRAGMFMEEAESTVVHGYIGRACTWGRAANGKLGHGAGKMTQADLKMPFAIYGPLYYYSICVVACGAEHSVCITDNGRIFSWGSNKEGQLGVGDTKARTQPALIEMCRDPDESRMKKASNKKFTNIVCGMWHCLAITSKKKVYAWGKNKYGQLGLGHTNNETTPCSILPLSDPFLHKHVRAISAGKSHSAVVVEDGDIFTWGRGWDGQLGHEVVTEIELEPRIVPRMQDKSCASVACGRAHTVVLTDNGNIWSWGENKAGQLGLGNLISTSQPQMVSDLDEQEVIMVGCGDEHTVCITIANEVYGFGHGVYDQLGLGTLGIFPNPQRIPGLTAVPRIRTLACGNYSTGVIGSDDTAYLLGRWDGISEKTAVVSARNAPVAKSAKGTTPDVLEVPLGVCDVRNIALGPHHGIVVGFEEDRQHLIQQRLEEEREELGGSATIMDNTAQTTDANTQLTKRRLVVPYVKQDHGGDPYPDELDDHNMHYAEDDIKDREPHDDFDRGEEEGGGAGAGGFEDDEVSVAESAQAADMRELAAVEPQMAANRKGYLVCWGNNQYNQLGPALDNQAQIKKDKTVQKHMKAIKVPKTKVGCPPTFLGPDALGANFNFPSISTVACGEYHTLAVAHDGTLWTWGKNTHGQLGHGINPGGDFGSHQLPKRVQGLEKKIVIKAAAGGHFSVVLTESNKVYAWGSNQFGQLGLGSSIQKTSTPDIVGALRRNGVCHITCGYSHCIALVKTEQLYAWGRNDSGQLGLGHYDHVRAPEHITALKKVQVQQISCGYDHCIAFVAEDAGLGVPPVEKIFTWGRGEEGQLGHEDHYSRCVPKVVSTLLSRGVRLVAAGGFSSAAIDEVKQVYTWGDGRDGQLGHNDQIDLTCPMIVKKPQDENAVEKDHISTFRARSIYLGPNFMLAMGLDAELEKRADPKYADRLTKFAWGTNEKGQLGMPYLNDKKRKIGDRKLQPEKIPFLTKWSIKEIACGLEHVVAVVELRQFSEEEQNKFKRNGEVSLEEDLLLANLVHLADGEFEADDLTTEAASDAAAAAGQAVVPARKAQKQKAELAEDDDEETVAMKEKLFHPRQIYDKLHSAEPFVCRLGLPPNVTSIFSNDANLDFESFLQLEEDDLISMGVESFGVRAIRELRAAPMLQQDVSDEFEMKLPAYTNEERKYKGVAQHEFNCHPADFLDYDDPFALEEGEPVRFDVDGTPIGTDKEGHVIALSLRDDFRASESEAQASEQSEGAILQPPQPGGLSNRQSLQFPQLSFDFTPWDNK